VFAKRRLQPLEIVGRESEQLTRRVANLWPTKLGLVEQAMLVYRGDARTALGDLDGGSVPVGVRLQMLRGAKLDEHGSHALTLSPLGARRGAGAVHALRRAGLVRAPIRVALSGDALGLPAPKTGGQPARQLADLARLKLGQQRLQPGLEDGGGIHGVVYTRSRAMSQLAISSSRS
jgi:hypothetical protein